MRRALSTRLSAGALLTLLIVIYPFADFGTRLSGTAAAQTAEEPEEPAFPEATQEQWDAALAALNAVVAEDEAAAGLAGTLDQESLGPDSIEAPADLDDPPPDWVSSPFDVSTSQMLVPATGEGEVVDFAGKRFAIASAAGGSVQIMSTTAADAERDVVVIEEADAPEEFGFVLAEEFEAMDLSFAPNPDGSGAYQILTSTGAVEAEIAAPWARTASGGSVPTSFRVDTDPATGHETLVQTVDHVGLPASEYPIVADPKVTKNCGNVTCTVYFSVNFSSQINHLVHFYGPDGSSSIMAVMCAPFAAVPPVAVICAAIVKTRYFELKHYSSQAAAEGRCLAFKYSVPTGTFWLQTNALSNQYCHAK